MTTQLSAEEIDDLLHWLVDRVGREWLLEQNGRGPDASHEIAEWIRLTEIIDPEDRAKVEQAHRIARLVRSLRALEAANVTGLDSRLADLKSENRDKFLSTHQELITAAKYLRFGYRVEFIDEGSERVFDLLVGDRFEVECKLKIPPGEADKSRRDLYDLLKRKIDRIMDRPSSSTGMYIRVNFKDEPTRADIEFVAQVIADVAGPSSTRSCTLTHGPVQYKIRSISRPGLGSPYVQTASFQEVHLGCDVTPECVKSLQRSLKSAAKQFTGERPALVHVDITGTLGWLFNENLAATRKILHDFLRNNTTISAVVLEWDEFRYGDEKLNAVRVTEAVWNYQARRPVGPELGAQLDVVRAPM